MTMSRVQSGPRNKDPNHQAKPLLPLDCAKPALINDSVNQPTAYSPGFCIVVILIVLPTLRHGGNCFKPLFNMTPSTKFAATPQIMGIWSLSVSSLLSQSTPSIHNPKPAVS